MADLTLRMSAAQYRGMLSAPTGTNASGQAGRQEGSGRGKSSAPGPKRARPTNSKYGNVATDGFDSKKEAATFASLEMARQAILPGQRVLDIERQKRYLVIEKQDGERAAHYLADFVVTYADGHVEVMDTKSVITRINPVYVLKRKLMLARHGIRILEV